ncbi:MAG: metallophosphoesterase [Anaerolineae bacterium]
MTLLRFVHISDTHISADPNYTQPYAETTTGQGVQALVEQINNLPFTPDFVLHTGDVAYDPYPEAYATCHAILSQIKYPVYYVAGNHDHAATLQSVMMGTTSPLARLHYTFEVNGVQFIVLDSNGPVEPPAGYVTEDQLSWLNNLCAEKDDRPLVVAVHHNPLSLDVPWLDNFMGIRNSAALHEALYPARHRLRGVFFGHVHQNIDIVRDGIFYSSTLSSWTQFLSYPGMVDTVPDKGAEPGFSVVSISPQQTLVRRWRFSV